MLVVASANRCRGVWAENLGFITVVGAYTDLELVELLATSPLVQANRAMLAAGRHVSSRGENGTRSFRQSFLISYATRIGERLETSKATVTADLGSSRLLPVLARSHAADDLTNRLFPSTGLPLMTARGTPASGNAPSGAKAVLGYPRVCSRMKGADQVAIALASLMCRSTVNSSPRSPR
ncbi:hypothetical protein ACRCUN_32010 [Mycobacterium sp. LTG2003]